MQSVVRKPFFQSEKWKQNVEQVITMSGTGVFGNTMENYSSGSRLHKAIFPVPYIDIENIITELPLWRAFFWA